MKKISTFVTFLGVMLISNYGHPSNLDKKLIFFLDGGQSKPISDFGGQVNPGFNWGGGVEFRFLPNWAVGTSVNRVDFKHKDIWYDSWNFSWRYTDWTFLRGYFWGKYILKAKGFSPFLKSGIGIYLIKDKNTIIGKSQGENQYHGFSLIPGIGFEYSVKNILFFIEADYNIITTKHLGGDRLIKQNSQFVDLFLGMGFTY